MTQAALDPGSRHAAIAMGERGSLRATSIEVGSDLGPAVERVMSELRAGGVDRLTIESGRIFVPEGTSARAAASMAQALATMAILVDRIEQACIADGIETARVARSTWVARIAGHVTRDDADIRKALSNHYDPEELGALTDEHQRDAAGILAWSRLPIEVKATSDDVNQDRIERHRAAARNYSRRKTNEARIAKGLPPKVYDDKKLSKARVGKHPSDVAFEKLMSKKGLSCD